MLLKSVLKLQVGCAVAVAQLRERAEPNPSSDLGHDIDAKKRPGGTPVSDSQSRGESSRFGVLRRRVRVVGVLRFALLLGAFGAQAIFFFFAVIEPAGWRSAISKISGVK